MLRTISIATALCLACAAQSARPRSSVGTAARTLTPEQQLELAAKKGVDADTVQLCEYERPTGSNIPEWRCRYLSDRERERFAAQKALLEAPGTGHPPQRLGGGGL